MDTDSLRNFLAAKNDEGGDLTKKATFLSKSFSAALVREHLKQVLPDHKKPEPLKTPAA